jgi:hypothetical protein
MTPDEYYRFTRDAGQLTAERLLKLRLNYDAPTQRDIKIVERVISETREEIRVRMFPRTAGGGSR